MSIATASTEHPDRFEVYQRVGDEEDAWFCVCSDKKVLMSTQG
jgi:hypothetical protein